MFKKRFLCCVAALLLVCLLFAVLLRGKTAAEYAGVSEIYPITRIELKASDYNETYPPHCLVLDPEEDAALYDRIVQYAMTERFLLWPITPQLLPADEIPKAAAIECRIPDLDGTVYRDFTFAFLENGKISFAWREHGEIRESGWLLFTENGPFSFEMIDGYIEQAE